MKAIRRFRPILPTPQHYQQLSTAA